jgi:hypothetical protein
MKNVRIQVNLIPFSSMFTGNKPFFLPKVIPVDSEGRIMCELGLMKMVCVSCILILNTTKVRIMVAGKRMEI